MAALTTIATIMSVAGTAVGMYGTYANMQASAAAADYNAQIAMRDAYVADQNRKAAIEQGRIDAEDKRRENVRTMSAIRAAYGASGLEMAGSPLDVLQDTAVEQELDVRRIQYEGRVRGREGALRMLGLQEEATLSSMEASAYRSGSGVTAIGSGLSGAGRTLSRVA